MDKYLLTIPRRIDRPLFGKNRGLARSVPRSVVDTSIYIYIYIPLYFHSSVGSILLANRGRSIETRHYIRKIFFEKSATARDRVSRIHKIFRSFSTLSPPPPNPLYRTDFCRSRGGIAILFPHRLPPLLRSDSVAERSLETRTIKSFSFTSESTIPVPSYISPSPLVYASRPCSRAISFLSFSSLSGIRSRW